MTQLANAIRTLTDVERRILEIERPTSTFEYGLWIAWRNYGEHRIDLPSLKRLKSELPALCKELGSDFTLELQDSLYRLGDVVEWRDALDARAAPIVKHKGDICPE